MPIPTILALALIFVSIAVHHVSAGLAAYALRGNRASRDELFVRGVSQLFGPPVYLRARFLLPWTHPRLLAGQSTQIRRTVAVARISGMATVAALALLVVVLSQGSASA